MFLYWVGLAFTAQITRPFYQKDTLVSVSVSVSVPVPDPELWPGLVPKVKLGDYGCGLILHGSLKIAYGGGPVVLPTTLVCTPA